MKNLKQDNLLDNPIKFKDGRYIPIKYWQLFVRAGMTLNPGHWYSINRERYQMTPKILDMYKKFKGISKFI